MIKKFIEWHKKIAEDFMNFFGLDHYGLMWYAWIEGFIVGWLIYWLIA